jgi:hypothetical protein
MSLAQRTVALLGATGSIGTQTLDVLRLESDSFQLVAISGGEHLSELAAIACEFHVPRIGVMSDLHRDLLRDLVGPDVDIVVGDEGLTSLSRDADIVVNAVLGFAGLPVTLAALQAGKRLALANKESLIAAAPLVARPEGRCCCPLTQNTARFISASRVHRRRRATRTFADYYSPRRADRFADGRRPRCSVRPRLTL